MVIKTHAPVTVVGVWWPLSETLNNAWDSPRRVEEAPRNRQNCATYTEALLLYRHDKLTFRSLSRGTSPWLSRLNLVVLFATNLFVLPTRRYIFIHRSSLPSTEHWGQAGHTGCLCPTGGLVLAVKKDKSIHLKHKGPQKPLPPGLRQLSAV